MNSPYMHISFRRYLTVLVFAILGLSLLSEAHAKDVPVNLEFDSSEYGKKKGKNDVKFPKHTTVMMIVRQEGKLRPLFLIGKNHSGMLKILFSNPGGMAPTFEASAKGKAEVKVGHASATKALDQETFAAGELLDEWREKPVALTVYIDTISQMKEKGKKHVAKQVLTLEGRSADKKKKAPVAKYAMQIEGRLQVRDTTVPFKTAAVMTIADKLQFFSCSFSMSLAFKAKELGLKRENPEDEIKIDFTTTAYSKMPEANKAPGIDDLDRLEESEDMDLDF